MATSARRVVAPDPPADLERIELPLAPTPRLWFRLTRREASSPLHWSRQGHYRFDSPETKWGVCYLAESIHVAFQEVWGDAIRRSRRLDWEDLEPMVAWQVSVSPALRTIELAGETLAVIKGTLQSFVSGYPKSQRWGGAFMEHPARLDGLQYLGRRSGRHCLALFGNAKPPMPHQKRLSVKKLGQLIHWKSLWPLLDRIHVRIANLPAKPPTGDWQ